jgi:dienelactone hydrolase
VSPLCANHYRKFALSLLALLSGVLAACGGDSGSGSVPPPITISVAANPDIVQPGSTAQVTATVSNDPSNSGVTWSVSCPTAPCGALSPTTTASGVATTYTAPATPPAAGLLVIVTATSVSNSAIGATANITVTGGVGFSELDIGNTTVLAGTTTQMAAKVINDPANRGVNWSVTCATAPCGTVSPSTSASGAPVTYTAPVAVPPADLAVTVTASAVSASSVQVSGTITVPALAVTVAPSRARVAAGTTSQLTASVNYPAQASKGVTWTVQCGASDCGTVSPPASASGAAVTYTVPATPPASDLTVTVTASSVSAPSVRGSATLTVAAVTVGVTPVSALIPLNVTQQFVGNVGYDPTSAGVAWTLMQGGAPCSSACGSLSPSATANGAASTYTAPGVLPANATVTVTATSVADHTKSATARVQLTSGSVKLAPADLNFIKVNNKVVPPPQRATLTNTGNSPLTINGITIGGANPNSFSQTNTCDGSVAPASSCVIIVSWHASGTAVLSISDSSTDSPQQLHLSATTSHQVTVAMRTALAGRAVVASPPPTGSSQVGTRVLYLIDATRADPYLSDGTWRDLPVRFWYPASADGGCVAANYTSAQVWNYFSILLGVSLPQVATHSCLNAPIAASLHPVVVISQGFTGTFTDYTFLAEDLASRGYVVASVDHTHEATAVEFPDGRLEKSVFGSHLTNYTRSDAGALGLAVAVRLDDLQFVLNELERFNVAPHGQFTGTLDLSRIALAGHSLGGLTTLRALESETRFKAGVLLDGLMPSHIAKPIQQPVLSLVVGRERWNEDDCRLWDALGGPRLAVNLRGAEHIALSDAVWLLKGLVRTGDSSPDHAIATIRDYVAAFLDTNLSGDAPRPLLLGPTPDHPEVMIANQAQALCSQP